MESEFEDQSCTEEDGCPTELAVLQRFWREQHQIKLSVEAIYVCDVGGNYGSPKFRCSGCNGIGLSGSNNPLEDIKHKSNCPYLTQSNF
jgi:hypothetical protein